MDRLDSPAPTPEGHDLTQVYADGRHMQAFLRMQGLYKQRISHIRSSQGAVHALDFGTGKDGLSRGLIEERLLPGDSLALYDRHAAIAQPRGQSRIVGAQEAFGYDRGKVNLVSIAFVLCLLEPEEARRTLTALREAHPEAEFIIVDYILKGKEQLVQLLQANEEKKWRRAIGDPEFIRTHTRFDVDGLCGLLEESGMPVTHAEVLPLDDRGIRAGVSVRPASEFFVAY